MKISEKSGENHKIDTDECVFFYEQEFYALSNFSSFRLMWRARDFDTAEHAYHWEKFPDSPSIQHEILQARSAHQAFRIAQYHKDSVRKDWDSIKIAVMRTIIWKKLSQHEYVFRKLLQTGDRQLIEDSWRDDFWGWGPNHNGKNVLGIIWMDMRDIAKDHTWEDFRDTAYDFVSY